jgi:ferritin
MSAMLAFDSWNGFAKLLAKQAAEEAQHAAKFAAYLVDQNRIPTYAPVIAPVVVAAQMPPLAFIQAALDRELLTTLRIDQLYHLAGMEESPATVEFLHWFVREQVEDVRFWMDLLREGERATCPAALLILDREHLK